MDIRCALLIALLGVICCYADGKNTKRDNLELGFDHDAVSNTGEPSLGGLLRKKRTSRINLGNNWWLGTGTRGHDKVGSLGKDFGRGGWASADAYDFDRFGASIGYRGNNWDVMGYGSVSLDGNVQGGISVGFRWRRKRSLAKPKPSFFLRVEVNPCHFAIFDRNSDGVITDEELRKVFPDRNLADGLFQRLDIEERGEITLKEFEAAKASGAIVGCAVPVYKERFPDESDLE